MLPAPTTIDDNYHAVVPVELVDKAKEYARASKASSTVRTYQSVWLAFTTWCSSKGMTSVPASPDTVVLYVTDMAESRKARTIKKHLAAISQIHKLAGHPSPVQSEPVKMVMAGLRRVKGTVSTPKKALSVEYVRRMVTTLPTTVVGVRDTAIILMGFLSGMRRSEIVGLDVADVVFEPEGLIIMIKRSKRDQEGKGHQVAVPRGRHEVTCPVRAVRARLDAGGIAQGPVFVRLDPGGQQGLRLDGRAAAHVVQRAAARAGLDPDMSSGHSLRRGFCTEAARAGAAERDIARTTGHSSMQVLRGYIEAGTLFEGCAGSVLDL